MNPQNYNQIPQGQAAPQGYGANAQARAMAAAHPQAQPMQRPQQIPTQAQPMQRPQQLKPNVLVMLPEQCPPVHLAPRPSLLLRKTPLLLNKFVLPNPWYRILKLPNQYLSSSP